MFYFYFCFLLCCGPCALTSLLKTCSRLSLPLTTIALHVHDHVMNEIRREDAMVAMQVSLASVLVTYVTTSWQKDKVDTGMEAKWSKLLVHEASKTWDRRLAQRIGNFPKYRGFAGSPLNRICLLLPSNPEAIESSTQTLPSLDPLGAKCVQIAWPKDLHPGTSPFFSSCPRETLVGKGIAGRTNAATLWM